MKNVGYAMYYFMPSQHVLSQRTQASADWEMWGQSWSLERGRWGRKQETPRQLASHLEQSGLWREQN